MEIKNVVELTSAFFECVSLLAESEDVFLFIKEIMKRLKVHWVQILDFLQYWGQVIYPFFIIN